MRGVNKALILGHLGHDPVIRYTPDEKAVATLDVATTIGQKVGDEWKDRTDWHKVVLFGKLAEVAKQYLRKGSKVYVEGSIQTREYEAKSGGKRYVTEIIGRDLQMLDRRPSDAPPAHPGPEQAPAPAEPAPADDDFDSDMPF